MADIITDTTDVPITFLDMTIPESTDGPVLVVRIPGKAHRWLTADLNMTVQIFGRKHGTADVFVDLHLSPIDLTPYDGMAVDYDIKVHAGAVTGIVSTGVNLRVTYNP